MSEWSAGYMADIDYTYGYYPELNPLRARLALLQAGLHAPAMRHACELGFGQGVTVNLHAAASGVHWAGTDFNPAHASFAQDLARAAGHGAQLHEQAFEAFCQRSDLPDFDFIGMHGIWSWVSDANRAILVDFLERKLRPGGVLYISYNTQPGWAAMAPMRDLLAEHALTMSAPGAGAVSRMESALAFAQQLMATEPVYGLINPHIAGRLQKLQGQDRNYLVHEYFANDWQPMGFSTMARWLAPAKLQWACSAHYMDSLDVINLTAAQRALLASIPDTNFRQYVRDFCLNQQFRKDYWVKGARALSVTEQAAQWDQQGFVLVQPRTQVKLQVTGRQAQITYNADIYHPLLDLLAGHQVRTGGQLEEALRPYGVGPDALHQALWVLCAIGAVQPAQDEAGTIQAQACTERLNSQLLTQAQDQSAAPCLASPITGGGVSVTPFEQQFLQARRQGLPQPADWGDYAWGMLQAQGKCLTRNGHALTQPQDSRAELQAQAQAFAQLHLPILQALGVA